MLFDQIERTETRLKNERESTFAYLNSSARLEGRQIGRARLDIDREKVVEDRRTGMSLTLVARKHSISRASVCRLMKEAVNNSAVAVLPFGGTVVAQVQA